MYILTKVQNYLFNTILKRR